MKRFVCVLFYLMLFMLILNNITYADTLTTPTINNNVTGNVITELLISPTNNNIPSTTNSFIVSNNIGMIEVPTSSALITKLLKIETIKYLAEITEIKTVSINEELKVSQNTNIRFTLNNNFDKSSIPLVYLNDNLISYDKKMLEITTANALEIILNSSLVKEKLNKITIEKIKDFNEFLFYFDTTPPSLNITSPLQDIYMVNKPNIVIEGSTDIESKVSISGMPIDTDTFGNFRKNIVLKPGKNTLIIEAEDICRNKTTTTRIIDYEFEYPILEFAIPTQNTWLKPNESFIFEVSVKDEQNDISEDAQPFIFANNKKIENIDFINYDPSNKKITGIYSSDNNYISNLLDFAVCIEDKMGHIGKANVILNLDNNPPQFSGLYFDGRTRTAQTFSKQNQKIYYNEQPSQKLYIDFTDNDSGIDLNNSSFYLKTDRNENVTLNILNISEENNHGQVELGTLENLDYGIYTLYMSARDKVGNVSNSSSNVTIVYGKEFLDSIMTQTVSGFEISRTLNYPNPCGSTGTNISFYSTVSPIELQIQIYSIAGELVRTFDLGTINSEADGFVSTFWNLTDDWGQTVSNGVYIYRILATDNQTTKILKGKIGVLK